MKEFHFRATIENDILSVESKNDGFSALEIIGLLEWKKEDVFKQMRDEIKPDIVKRELVKE